MPRWTIPLVGRPDQEDGAFMDVRPGSPVLDSALRLTDGRMLCYAVWGDPRGRPVLLFHGSPASRLFRPDAAVTETAGVRLITVDRPGYGGSDPRPLRGIPDWPADVTQLVDALGLERFGLVAHSSGGPYALAAAVSVPDRVTGVALVSCVVPLDEVPAARAALDDDGRKLVELAREDPERAGAVIAAAAGWLAVEPDRFLSLSRPEPDARLLEDPATRSMFLEAVREAVRSGLAGYISDEVAERRDWGFRLSDVDVDVAVWHGGLDHYIPVSQAEAMAALLPRARSHFHADQAHGLILTRWAAILDDLAD